SKLAPGDKRFKGEKAQYYTENGVYKYTIGESNSYEEIQQIKKNLSEKFKEAFVVAFLNGKKINTQEAVKISQKQK
ncbi:MAG: N-acetylmuramoyl-L-alanine amidase, partial [Bacteroidaceae bacterium]|nr:N-acetylmuramoyl-L-alanine amidase [Bacteroidaceae bacterium]